MSSDDLIPSINRLVEAVREDRAERRAAEREEREERRDNDKERRDVGAVIIEKLGALHTSLIDMRAVLLAATAEEGKQGRHDVRNAIAPFVMRLDDDTRRDRRSSDTAAAGGERERTGKIALVPPAPSSEFKLTWGDKSIDARGMLSVLIVVVLIVAGALVFFRGRASEFIQIQQSQAPSAPATEKKP